MTDTNGIGYGLVKPRTARVMGKLFLDLLLTCFLIYCEKSNDIGNPGMRNRKKQEALQLPPADWEGITLLSATVKSFTTTHTVGCCTSSCTVSRNSCRGPLAVACGLAFTISAGEDALI